MDVIADKLKDLSSLFKLHSLDEFNEAIDIELNGDDSDKQEDAPKVTKTSNEDNDGSTETTSNEDMSEPSSQEENSETETNVGVEDGAKDIKSLRKGILNKLKIQEEA